jgi:hypothetical protein
MRLQLLRQGGADLPATTAAPRQSAIFIWAPPDWIRDQLDLFVMSSDGFARQMKLEWVDNTNCDYRACSIDGQRFGRE